MAEPARARGIRERVRAQMTAEILSEARAQLSSAGADGLSLRAISRELGMASSAIYRYFPSRDALLTQLIIDAYDAVGEAAETAESDVPRTGLKRRFLATATAVREWALANPHEYALIFGSPVPGYAAPQDTIVPATRIPVVLIGILLEGAEADRVRLLPPLAPEIAESLQPLLHSIAEIVQSQSESHANQVELDPSDGAGHHTDQGLPRPAAPAGDPTKPAKLAQGNRDGDSRWPTGAAPGSIPAEAAERNNGTEFPAELIARGLIAWTHLIGALNFELFGHRHNVIGGSEAARRTFFDYEMSTMIDLTGIE